MILKSNNDFFNLKHKNRKHCFRKSVEKPAETYQGISFFNCALKVNYLFWKENKSLKDLFIKKIKMKYTPKLPKSSSSKKNNDCLKRKKIIYFIKALNF